MTGTDILETDDYLQECEDCHYEHAIEQTVMTFDNRFVCGDCAKAREAFSERNEPRRTWT